MILSRLLWRRCNVCAHTERRPLSSAQWEVPMSELIIELILIATIVVPVVDNFDQPARVPGRSSTKLRPSA